MSEEESTQKIIEKLEAIHWTLKWTLVGILTMLILLTTIMYV